MKSSQIEGIQKIIGGAQRKVEFYTKEMAFDWVLKKKKVMVDE